MVWKFNDLIFNEDGDCLFEANGDDWTTVHGCDSVMEEDGEEDHDCECNLPSETPFGTDDPLTIVRKPCEPTAEVIDAVGFLLGTPVGLSRSMHSRGGHCLGCSYNGDWLDYYYNPGETTRPSDRRRPSAPRKLNGILYCTNADQQLIGIGGLVMFKHKSELLKLLKGPELKEYLFKLLKVTA